MPLDTLHVAVILLAGFLAGALNAVAGGGSFLTFPALVFAGVPAVMANATSTVALLPATFTSAWAYRNDLGEDHGLPMRAFVIVSLLGGAVGSLLLLWTPDRTFERIVPWLLLFATIVFTFGRQLSERIRRRMRVGVAALVATQAIIGIYGGYFGGGIGILMLAMLGLYGMTGLHAMNAVKTFLSGCMNIVAAAIFVFAGAVSWLDAGIMLVAAVVGGWIGPVVARRVPQPLLRAFVSLVGVAMTIAFFVRSYFV